MYPAFIRHERMSVRISPGQPRMNSSMVERRLVKPRVESSNLSSSANGRIAPMVEHRFEEPDALVRVQLRPHEEFKTMNNGTATMEKTGWYEN